MIPISPGRSRRATLAGAVCALLVAGTALTGCSEDPNEGTNGVGRLPADQIQTKAQKAAASAGTVRLHGSVQTSGRTYTLDMRLKPQGGIGSVSTEGETFRLLRVGQELYLKADAAFWGKGGDGDGDSKAADKLASKYVKVPKGDPSYTKFIGFTDKNVLLGGLLTLHGKLSTDGHHEQGGTRTVRVTGDDGAGGTLDVSLEGTPYPLRLVRAGEAGTLTFSSWGTDFPLEKPAKDDTLDYGKQLPTS
ncbi:hypothetical protein ACFWJE_27845 [Streptomyces griseoincarnatus]|uniref:hypothetical protein n=1 Tax=unclassified Streptomyces TaxID=2593676 RepID=UPI000EFA79F2|nr:MULTISPECIES: hypothetical protein [unclassified Streptomyces]MBJ6634622.1 hypothetical protein [Streptomyces sp. I5]NUV56040.1 hypothetical protein [Streptomyces coelicolor]RMI92127.1 hypothetical protein BIU87_18150 [Streptomyces sp. ZS0098]